MSCTVLLSCSVCLSACLLSFLHVEILTEKSHNALCSTQPTAKGLIIIGASQGKADTSIHPDSKPCSDDLIRYLLFASRLLSHYMRINLFIHRSRYQRMSLLLPNSLEDIGRMAGTFDGNIPPSSRPTSSHQIICYKFLLSRRPNAPQYTQCIIAKHDEPVVFRPGRYCDSGSRYPGVISGSIQSARYFRDMSRQHIMSLAWTAALLDV